MSFQPSFTQWYGLTNAYMGPGFSLAVVNDNGVSSSGTLQMAATGADSAQYWQFEAYQIGPNPTYGLYTQLLGDGMRLDVLGDDNTNPHLEVKGDFSGQSWTLTPWGDGSYQLTNDYSGSDVHLDVYADTKAPCLAGGDDSGQHWFITQLDDLD